MKIITAALLFGVAQIMAWFQCNSGILGGWLSENYVYVAIVFGPIVSVLFATGTKMMYDTGMSLWSIRFLTFGIGYAIFIPLTWYFLGEETFSVKNIISFVLCVALISTQLLFK